MHCCRGRGCRFEEGALLIHRLNCPLEDELKMVKVERAEADNVVHQLRANLLSVEQKFAASDKECKAAVATVVR